MVGKAILSKNQSKHSKLCKVKAPLVFRMTNLCCFSNEDIKFGMLCFALAGKHIHHEVVNMLMFTLKALLTPC